ncbi:hypothetical protein MCHI_003218 [Candidatus Magnetoovum chiemensis]|nr:hypothetical protein MCHI_003218 [Candidatus Magnetoovum chiemensis]
MRTKLIGIIIIAAAIIGGISAKVLLKDSKKFVIRGPIGGEKVGFFNDEDVINTLAKKYGIVVDYSKRGSIEMVTEDQKGQDFLFPSSQVALELFKSESKSLLKDEIIFNSPIVLYSWDIVTKALIEHKIVEEMDKSYYIVDFPKLINLIVQGTKWTEIGLNDLYGNMTIISTDPTKSNSGNMFAGLLANILNNGEVVNETNIDVILPKVKEFFLKLGYLEHSSGDLFEQFLRTGVGAKPIIVGYENQIVEFSIQNKSVWDNVKGKINILYPVPTVWSSHPLISLTPNGTLLLEALKDKDLQRLAWEKHGFRTGLIGVDNDIKILDIVGIPEKIKKVISMPSPKIMDMIIEELK